MHANLWHDTTARAGLIYNDYFALPLNLFGSRYDVQLGAEVLTHTH